MGRKVRRVPPNWLHPQVRNEYTGKLEDQPMFDERFNDAFTVWITTFDRVRASDTRYPRGLADWLLYYRAPDPAYYRPWKDEEATWVQLWHTVGEGTPVSPPFATRDELVNYLAENGDYWDQKRAVESGRSPGWGLERAKAFVKEGWAPSFAISGDAVLEPKDIPLAFKKEG